MKIQNPPQAQLRSARPNPSSAPRAEETHLQSDHFTTGLRTGAAVGGLVAGAAGLYLASRMGPTGLAVAGGIGAAATGGVLGAWGLGSLAGNSRSGGEGAVLGLAGGALGLVLGAAGGGYLGATNSLASTIGTAAGMAAGGAIVGGVAGFFLA